jgi:hypothetical protein
MRGGGVLLLAATFALCGGMSTALGTTYVVNSTGDGDNVGRGGTTCSDVLGHCTLRGAIEASNNATGADSISLKIPTTDPGYSNGVWTINLTKALPDISDAVSINGPGADKLTVQNANPQNNNAFRIFNVTTSGTVSFSGINVAHGWVFSQTDYLGGGIQNYNAGIVNLTNCTVTTNVAARWFDQNGNVGPFTSGGGIANRAGGTINILSSTFDGNSANLGGGIYNSTSGIINITNSTITNHDAGIGGGIYNIGTIRVTNSTLDHNHAIGQGTDPGNGGGIYNFAGNVSVVGSTIGPQNIAANGAGIYNDDSGTLSITNSTISYNQTDSDYNGNGSGIFNKATLSVSNSTIAVNSGGLCEVCSGSSLGIGIYNDDSTGSATIKSTIIALNSGFIASDVDVYGSFISQGYNLIGIRDGSAGFTASTDQTGTCAGPNPGCNAPLDPQFESDSLGPIFKNNGGLTQTFALLPGSPAIDKGTSNGLNGVLTTDQRGAPFPRKFDVSSVANASGGDGADVGAFEFLTIKITSIADLANGHIVLQGLGVPNALHHIQGSPDLSSNSFGAIGTTTADNTGILQFDDAGAVGLTKRFYRLTFP